MYPTLKDDHSGLSDRESDRICSKLAKKLWMEWDDEHVKDTWDRFKTLVYDKYMAEACGPAKHLIACQLLLHRSKRLDESLRRDEEKRMTELAVLEAQVEKLQAQHKEELGELKRKNIALKRRHENTLVEFKEKVHECEHLKEAMTQQQVGFELQLSKTNSALLRTQAALQNAQEEKVLLSESNNSWFEQLERVRAEVAMLKKSHLRPSESETKKTVLEEVLEGNEEEGDSSSDVASVGEEATDLSKVKNNKKSPLKCTVAELKSWLTSLDVILPPNSKPKQFYLDLLYQHEPSLANQTAPTTPSNQQKALAGKRKKLSLKSDIKTRSSVRKTDLITFTNKEPIKCTIAELKSWLTKLDVTLPSNFQHKQYYLDLLYEHEPSLAGQTAPKTPGNSSKKKSRKT